jgi:hypothetical protein
MGLEMDGAEWAAAVGDGRAKAQHGRARSMMAKAASKAT